MPVPIGIPRAYYFTDETIQDFEENDLESFSPWMESVPPNVEREPNCSGPQQNSVTGQWASIAKAQTSKNAEGSQRERHHIQVIYFLFFFIKNNTKFFLIILSKVLDIQKSY